MTNKELDKGRALVYAIRNYKDALEFIEKHPSSIHVALMGSPTNIMCPFTAQRSLDPQIEKSCIAILQKTSKSCIKILRRFLKDKISELEAELATL